MIQLIFKYILTKKIFSYKHKYNLIIIFKMYIYYILEFCPLLIINLINLQIINCKILIF